MGKISNECGEEGRDTETIWVEKKSGLSKNRTMTLTLISLWIFC